MSKRMCLHIVISLTAIFGWLGLLRIGHSAQKPSLPYDPGVGGRMGSETIRALQMMHTHLRDSRLILEAGSHTIRFVQADEQITQYTYAHRALWLDRFPVVSGVEAFQFEYRNGTGDRLVRPENGLNSVELVCYTIRLSRQGKDVMANDRIPVKRGVVAQDDSRSGPVKLASADKHSAFLTHPSSQ